MEEPAEPAFFRATSPSCPSGFLGAVWPHVCSFFLLKSESLQLGILKSQDWGLVSFNLLQDLIHFFVEALLDKLTNFGAVLVAGIQEGLP